MKIWFSGAALAVVLMSGAAAQEEASRRDAGVYLRAGGGVSFAEDLDQDLSYNPNFVSTVMPANARATSLNEGLSLSAAIGFQYPGRTRTELEYRFMRGDIDTVIEDGGFDPTSSQTWPVAIPADDTQTVHALMSNVYIDLLPGGRVSPYVGAGVGGARVENGLGDRDAAFAYQGRAGVDFNFGGGLSLGAEYVYLRTLDVVYGPKEFEPAGPAGPRVDGDPFVSSSVMATLRKLF